METSTQTVTIIVPCGERVCLIIQPGQPIDQTIYYPNQRESLDRSRCPGCRIVKELNQPPVYHFLRLGPNGEIADCRAENPGAAVLIRTDDYVLPTRQS